MLILHCIQHHLPTRNRATGKPSSSRAIQEIVGGQSSIADRTGLFRVDGCVNIYWFPQVTLPTAQAVSPARGACHRAQ